MLVIKSVGSTIEVLAPPLCVRGAEVALFPVSQATAMMIEVSPRVVGNVTVLGIAAGQSRRPLLGLVMMY